MLLFSDLLCKITYTTERRRSDHLHTKVFPKIISTLGVIGKEI